MFWANDTSSNIAESTSEQTFVLPENWEMNDDRTCDIIHLFFFYFLFCIQKQ